MESFDIVIVGSGHAGAQCAVGLRQRGFRGSIAIVGEEPDLPYERPPLSKEYLSGAKAFDRILLRPAAFWADREIVLLSATRVTTVDSTGHRVTTAQGTKIGYRQLVWATGGRPRKLSCSGHSLIGVHSVRNRADVDQMIADMPSVGRVVVIGGGYIGLEAAAVLTNLGKKVTLLETLDRVLARVASEAVSRFYEAEHRAQGVDLRLGETVACVVERGGRVAGVRLASGELLAADMVIVGIGIIPAVEPLIAAGAEGNNGVAVDRICRTSLPDVWSIGDCALHQNAFAGNLPIRIESVQNANDMANTVAKALSGVEEPYHAVPWFWSNQYDLKLQTIGLSAGYDRAIVRGNPMTRSFSVVYLNQGQVIAIDCVNAVKDFVQGRSLVIQRTSVSPDLISDANIDLKTFATSASEAEERQRHDKA